MASTFTSSSVLKDVEEQLTCPICLSLFEKPKVLKCHHVFCSGCLKKCIVTDRERRSFVRCSSCRQDTPLPEGGVENLEVAFSANKLFDTRSKLLESMEKVESNTDKVEEKKTCKLHPNRVIELWCETCSTLICFQCSLEGEQHHHHHFYLASKLVEQMKQEVLTSHDALKQHQKNFKATLEELDAHAEELYSKKSATEHIIRDKANLMRDAITSAEESAIRNLYSMVEEQATKLSPYRDKLEDMISRFQACIEKLLTTLDLTEPGELINAKDQLCAQASMLSKKNQSNAFLSLHEANEVDFHFDEVSLFQALQDDFFVYAADVCTSKIQVSGNGLESAIVGKYSSFKVEAFSSTGEPSKYQFLGLDCELRSDITKQIIPLVRTKESINSLQFSYQPNLKGNHSLEIRYKGKAIPNSPYRVAVLSHKALNFSKPIHRMSTGICPTAMVLFEDKVIVSSSSSYHFLNPQRTFFSHPEKTATISEMIVVKKDALFAVVSMNEVNSIVELDINSSIVNTILTFSCSIADIAYCKTRNLLIVLFTSPINYSSPGYVAVYSLKPEVKKLSSFQIGQGKTNYCLPRGMTIDEATSRVFIADSYHNHIQVFDYNGKYLKKITAKSLIKPKLLTTTRTNLFVSNGANTIHVFDLNGSLQYTTQSPYIENIVSLAVDNCNILYVCDDKQSQVLLF